jgi:D-alanyl-D-alanine carboxypeptidase
MGRFLLALSSFLVFGACVEPEGPAARVECDLDTSSHPKHARYQAIVDDHVARGIPGLSVTVLDANAGAWVGAAGYANLEEGVAMTPCHVHHFASIAKTFTAALILDLYEEGRIELDDPITAHLPEAVYEGLPNSERITIRQLLNHSSGLPEVFDIELVIDFLNDPLRRYDSQELLGYVRGARALAEPGESFYYSEANYLLLTLIADALTGGHERAIRERLLVPLALDDSYYHDLAYLEHPGLVRSYWDRRGRGELENVSDWQVAATAIFKGGDGLVGTVSDLAAFMATFGGGELVAGDTYAAMTDWIEVPEEGEGPETDGYGFGLMRHDDVNGPWIGHSGSQLAAASFAFFHPETGTTVVAAMNAGTIFSLRQRALFFGSLLPEIKAAALE